MFAATFIWFTFVRTNPDAAAAIVALRPSRTGRELEQRERDLNFSVDGGVLRDRGPNGRPSFEGAIPVAPFGRATVRPNP
jgi:hypothetical protein